MLLIKNGYLKTMAGEDIENGDILIKEDRILQIGSSIHCPKDQDVQVIDVNGALVMPGIIECHCHIGITEEKKGSEGDDGNEVTNPITPFLRAIDGINPMDAAFHDAIQAGITTVLVGPGSSNVVGGQFAVLKTYGRVLDKMIVKAPAAMKIAFGENPKKNFGDKDKMPATRMAIAFLLREELTKAKNYLAKKEEAKKNNEAFEIDIRYDCWEPVFAKKIPLKAHVHRTDDIITAIRIAKEFDLNMTLDHCSEGHLIADYIKESGYPAIVGPNLASRNKIEVQNAAFKTAGVLQREGVLLTITTDHPVTLVQSLPICAGLAAKAGLGVENAYKAMTINAAKIIGLDHLIGSLEVGKIANIAIYNGNPMETLTKTLYTIIDGVVRYDYKKAD